MIHQLESAFPTEHTIAQERRHYLYKTHEEDIHLRRTLQYVRMSEIFNTSSPLPFYIPRSHIFPRENERIDRNYYHRCREREIETTRKEMLIAHNTLGVLIYVHHWPPSACPRITQVSKIRPEDARTMPETTRMSTQSRIKRPREFVATTTSFLRFYTRSFARYFRSPAIT